MAGGFNMMELMNKATQGEAKPKYEAATLPIEKIIPSPGNFYSMEGIEELADSILLARGVLQNIVVRSADADGRYMIISGHRRVAACRKLVEDGHAEFGEIAALIENEADENLRELMLIYTNSTSRILTDAEKMRQAQKTTEILKNLKAEGKFEGRIREAVSRMLDTTGAQLARYAAIDKNLTNPELKEAFEDGRLGVSAAYEASGLSKEGQGAIADKLAEGGAVSIQDVKEAKEQEKPAEKSKVAAAVAKYESQGMDALTDCEKCKLTTRCEDCCRTCPPEKHCNVRQCEIESKKEKEQIAKEQAEHNASIMARTKETKPETEPPAEETEKEPPVSPEVYALTTILNELTALEESYRGAAERHVAMGGDHAGKVNLETTAHHLQILINRTKSDLAFWKQKAESEKE